jgi:hypothetical protein
MTTIGQSEEVKGEARTYATQVAEVGPYSTTKEAAVKGCHADCGSHGNSPSLLGGSWGIKNGPFSKVASACACVPATATSNAQQCNTLENQPIGNMIVQGRSEVGKVAVRSAVAI